MNASPSAPSAPTPIDRLVLLRVLWRSFFLLATANYERMQNVGFGYAMLPALERLYEGEALQAALNRHLVFFNSHPYMTGTVLGAAIRIEEDIARGDSPPERVEIMKRQMMAPLAAIGDSFFWTSLRPLGATLAVTGLLAGWLWAPLLFVLLYNICHVGIRAYGFKHGYAQAEQVFMQVQRLRLARWADWAHVLTGGVVGVLAALFVRRAQVVQAIGDGIEPILLATLVCISALFIKRRLPMLVLLYAFVLGAVLFVAGLEAVFPVL